MARKVLSMSLRFCAVVIGGTIVAGVAPAQSSKEEVLAIDASFNEAIRQNNAQERERIYSDQYMITNVRGRVVTKAQALEEVTSGNVTYDSFHADDIQVRMYGDVAVVTGRTSVHKQVSSADYRAEQRYTRVYVKRQGRWQLDAAQITAIEPPASDAAK